MKEYFRKIAIGLNAGLLIVVIVMLTDAGQMDGTEILVVLLAIAAPAFTLLTLFAPDEK